MKQKHIRVRLGYRQDRVDPPPPPDPLPVPEDAVARAQYEADAAKAETARLKKQLDDIKKELPNEEQRARWADLEKREQTAEEERRRKAGEFDGWRQQIEEKHTKDMDATRQQIENERAKAETTDRELNDTLVGLAFSGATEWFGPGGKTVLLPSIAQSYFAPHVSVEVVPGLHGAPAKRRVIVKDYHGSVILDTKSGQPMAFAQAIGEVIDAHPQKAHLMRGSGKVGSGSPGGDNALQGRDLSRLKQSDFKDAAVRDAVRDSLTAPGGLRIGPGFDEIERARRQRSGGKP